MIPILISIAKSIDQPKLFLGGGIGYYFDSLRLGNDKHKQSNFYYELSGGLESMFDEYNGFNLTTSFSFFQFKEKEAFNEVYAWNLGLNYVLEPEYGELHFGIITEFDIGFRATSYFNITGSFLDDRGLFNYYYHSTQLVSEHTGNPPGYKDGDLSYLFAMNYNLGFRIRYENFALLFNIKFPLFPVSTPLEHRYYVQKGYYDLVYKDLIGTAKVSSYPIVGVLSFIYFFE